MMETDAQIGGGPPGIAALFRAYAAGKAGEEWHGEWAAALLYRPVAILAAPALLRLGVPATGVTLAALLLVLGLPAMAWAWGAVPVALAAILIGMLDCLDGTIARASGSVSRSGHYLDFLTDIVFRASFYAAIGLVAARAAPHWLAGLSLPLALVAALLAIAARLCRVYAEKLTGSAPYGEPVKRDLSTLAFSLVSGMDGLTPLIVLLLTVTGGMGWLVLWLVFYSALDFLYTQVATLSRMS
jgi:phosphatidylglycerophosphate synthase